MFLSKVVVTATWGPDVRALLEPQDLRDLGIAWTK